MKHNNSFSVEESFRRFYGQIFSALLYQFGPEWTTAIEDAIQNAFYKSLKSWKSEQFPADRGNWLFVVAKNDLINQIKRSNQTFEIQEIEESISTKEDQRLHFIFAITRIKSISQSARQLFILKNIFGLSVGELSLFTLQSEEAIYKSLNRTKQTLKVELKSSLHDENSNDYHGKIDLVEDVLHAVFNTSFDSFNPKMITTVNDDLCLDALALAKNLSTKYEKQSTRNLIALMCFHLARIPAKIVDGSLVSFFNQDRQLWDENLIQLGFQNLTKADQLDKYYLEALIVSKHMTAVHYDADHWYSIIGLYKLLYQLVNSPFILLNLAYCYHKAGNTEESHKMIEEIKEFFPEDHLYYSMIKIHIDSTKTEFDQKIMLNKILKNVDQEVRKGLIQSYFIDYRF